jgi:DNA-binding transcriptional ArsR family regulator
MGKRSMDAEQDQVFERAAELFALLSTPVRLRIVLALLEGERNVTELVRQLGVSQPNLSQHLATLYRCGLLLRRRDGMHMVYRVAQDRWGQLAQWMAAQAASTAP